MCGSEAHGLISQKRKKNTKNYIYSAGVHFGHLKLATLRIYFVQMVWKSLWARADTSPLYIQTEKTANNNQFNYPQNIYCRIGFVMQTQRRRVATTSDFLLHSARPFSRRFVVVIAWFSVCCFTRPSYQCGFSGCAAASIYTYHPDLRWVCHICCFIFCLLLGAIALFFFLFFF